MTEVERIWRIRIEPDEAIELRLAAGPDGDQQVVLEQLGSGPLLGALDIEVARAVAQAMLEACEVAAALREQMTLSR